MDFEDLVSSWEVFRWAIAPQSNPRLHFSPPIVAPNSQLS